MKFSDNTIIIDDAHQKLRFNPPLNTYVVVSFDLDDDITRRLNTADDVLEDRHAIEEIISDEFQNDKCLISLISEIESQFTQLGNSRTMDNLLQEVASFNINDNTDS